MLTVTITDHNKNPVNSHFDWSVIGPVARERNVVLGLGICLPASCSPEKVVAYANKIYEEDNLEASLADCRTNDPIKIKAVDVFAM